MIDDKVEEKVKEKEKETACSGMNQFQGWGSLAIGVGGMFGSIAGAPFTGGQSLWGTPAAGMMLTTGWDKLSACNKAKSN
ncbi:hypothetical protein [Tsukamurella pulmonis]|uniref:hypothetical protein n=1 Tax=Tsukamurella pulmonis TaxID=47312 RepID=UPI001EE039DB|nr:hypothetical protein [Tsukamurella pulmonis]